MVLYETTISSVVLVITTRQLALRQDVKYGLLIATAM